MSTVVAVTNTTKTSQDKGRATMSFCSPVTVRFPFSLCSRRTASTQAHGQEPGFTVNLLMTRFSFLSLRCISLRCSSMHSKRCLAETEDSREALLDSKSFIYCTNELEVVGVVGD